MDEKKLELEAERSARNVNLFHGAVGAVGGGLIAHSVVTRSKDQIDRTLSGFRELLYLESYKDNSSFVKIKEELSKFTDKEDLHNNAKELFEKLKRLNLQRMDDLRDSWNEKDIKYSDHTKKLEIEYEKLKQSFNSKFKDTLKYIKSVNNSKNAGIIIAAGTAITGLGAFVLSSIATSKNIAENKRRKPIILSYDDDISAYRSR